MTVSKISDQISLVNAEVSEATSTPQKISTFIFCADNYPLDPKPHLTARVKQVGGGEGYIKVRDITNAQDLLVKTITDSNWAIIEEDLSNYIASGDAVVEITIYTNATGEIFVDCASMCMTWVS